MVWRRTLPLDVLPRWWRALRSRWSPTGHRLGRLGERRAARYLRLRGYRIMARNFKAAGAELDVVARHRRTLVFVEVKARAGASAGRPEEAVDERKQRQLRKAAEIFALRHRMQNWPMRFDVIAISQRGWTRRVEHFKDAF